MSQTVFDWLNGGSFEMIITTCLYRSFKPV